MKKKLFILGLSFLSSFTLANNADAKSVVSADQDEPKINIMTRHEIMGLWGMDIAKNPQCKEYYNFNSSSSVMINSDKEWSIGQYQYQVPNNRSEQLPALVIQIKYDNNETDCSGFQEDQTGEVQQFFVKWNSMDQIEFCAGNKGENCFARLSRVRP